MIPDTLLIQRMKAGDEYAMNQFIHKYYPDISKYCHLHVNDSFLAEDITQDTFERFFRNLKQYLEYGKALNYLYVIAANNCKDYFKKKKEVLLEEMPYYLDSNTKVYESPTEKLMKQIDIRDAVNTLPEECFEVAILYFFQELKIREIAVILGIGQPLVKYRIKKARILLTEALRKE